MGYGEYYLRNTVQEMWFLMMLEMCSVLVPATVLFAVNRLVTGLDNSFEHQMR